MAQRKRRAAPPKSVARTERAQPRRAKRGAEQAVKILVLSGPNLDRLGRREPAIYGSETLSEIHERLAVVGADLGVQVDCRQSAHEGTLVDWIGSAEEQGFAGILINGAAYTHTSIALYDALRATRLPAVEVHLSNPAAREAFRHHSYLAPACIGTICGFRGESYVLALWGLVSLALKQLGRRK